jgi:hypothetical protein
LHCCMGLCCEQEQHGCQGSTLVLAAEESGMTGRGMIATVSAALLSYIRHCDTVMVFSISCNLILSSLADPGRCLSLSLSATLSAYWMQVAQG